LKSPLNSVCRSLMLVSTERNYDGQTRDVIYFDAVTNSTSFVQTVAELKVESRAIGIGIIHSATRRNVAIESSLIYYDKELNMGEVE
jgi:hypothetical protein